MAAVAWTCRLRAATSGDSLTHGPATRSTSSRAMQAARRCRSRLALSQTLTCACGCSSHPRVLVPFESNDRLQSRIDFVTCNNPCSHLAHTPGVVCCRGQNCWDRPVLPGVEKGASGPSSGPVAVDAAFAAVEDRASRWSCNDVQKRAVDTPPIEDVDALVDDSVTAYSFGFVLDARTWCETPDARHMTDCRERDAAGKVPLTPPR